MDIGIKIKELRKQARLTQEEFALRVGVGLRFIRDLEQGKKTIRCGLTIYKKVREVKYGERFD